MLGSALLWCMLLLVETNTAPANVPSVIRLIEGKPNLDNLTRLIFAAGLTNRLNGTALVTVFAPDDDAFRGSMGH